MSAGRHTPGPWHAGQLREQGHQPGVDLVAEDGLCVALVRHEPAAYDRAETLANARLIAAAPDLLDALRGLMEHVGGGDAEAELEAIHAAERALARVEGGP